MEQYKSVSPLSKLNDCVTVWHALLLATKLQVHAEVSRSRTGSHREGTSVTDVTDQSAFHWLFAALGWVVQMGQTQTISDTTKYACLNMIAFPHGAKQYDLIRKGIDIAFRFFSVQLLGYRARGNTVSFTQKSIRIQSSSMVKFRSLMQCTRECVTSDDS